MTNDNVLINLFLATARVEPLEIISGVYFLFKEGELVYVGKSRDIHSRVRRHVKDPAKDFDEWAHIRASLDEIDALEKDYIRIYQPRLNRTGTPFRSEPHGPSFILYGRHLYEDVEVTDEMRRDATETIAQIMRGGPVRARKMHTCMLCEPLEPIKTPW